MTPFPLPLAQIFGHWGAYLVFLVIGFLFGYVLEIAGFANSPKLAAQFYFKDLTVLKVMFSAIVVAMVLIFGASAMGLLDTNLIWVNPTYLWPGILGGLIMGAGFIVGGFCPGTSLVAAATLKIDGLFFALGAFFGIFLFGETVGYYDEFWNSSYMGRFTIPDWLGLSTGLVALLVVLMALFMFWGGEQLERIFGGKDPAQAPKWRYAAAGALMLGAVVLIALGQPTTGDRWRRLAGEKEALLAGRAVQIHPGELLDLLHARQITVRMLDVRDEADYNLFHILDAEHIPLAQIPAVVPALHLEPANTVVVVMSNDETAATEAWKILVAESVPNVYILEGGINNWLDHFADNAFKATATTADDRLRYTFNAALGAHHLAAEPNPELFELTYTPKVQLELKRAPASGGCG
ncbi:MAG TPA: rhodanese-like domain-containing protein [Anaerolineae bacterium]